MVKPGGIFRTLSKSYEVLFVKRVNVFQPLIIFAKVSILDIWQSSECASEFHINIHNSINNRAMVITDIFIAATPFSCLSILRWLHLSTTSGKETSRRRVSACIRWKRRKDHFCATKNNISVHRVKCIVSIPKKYGFRLTLFQSTLHDI